LPERTQHLGDLRDRLEAGLRERIPDLVVNGAPVERLPNTLSAAFPGTVAFEVAERARDVATAAGAACHSGKPHVSAVLAAMGLEEDLALATLRLSLGSPTTDEEINRAVTSLSGAVLELRSSGLT
jgi:cysteine desulfurase